MPAIISPTRRRRRQKQLILRDVSDGRLLAAICMILRERHLRAHPELDPETFMWNPDPKEIDVQQFIDEYSIQQVRVLRYIALELKEEVEHVQ